MTDADAAVAAFAATRHGIVTTAEAVARGLSRDQVASRVRAGLWRRMHHGVYFVGVTAPTPEARSLAAVLACGEGAVASHWTAAALHRLCPGHGGERHVCSTVKGEPQRGLRRHWTRDLPPHDVTTLRRIPVTSLRRTLIDLADVATATQQEEAIRAAERIHRFDRKALEPIHGRRGAGRVHGTDRLLRGHLEPLFARLLDEHGLAHPAYNAPVGPYVLDALYPAQRLAIEVDDYDTHAGRDAFDRDRARDRDLEVTHRIRSHRVTHADLASRPARRALARELRALGVPLASAASG